jgi:hypothetical protein
MDRAVSLLYGTLSAGERGESGRDWGRHGLGSQHRLQAVRNPHLPPHHESDDLNFK